MRRHVAEVDVEAVLPEKLSGVGVEAHHPFLFQLAFLGGVLQVDSDRPSRSAQSVRRKELSRRDFVRRATRSWANPSPQKCRRAPVHAIQSNRSALRAPTRKQQANTDETGIQKMENLVILWIPSKPLAEEVNLLAKRNQKA